MLLFLGCDSAGKSFDRKISPIQISRDWRSVFFSHGSNISSSHLAVHIKVIKIQKLGLSLYKKKQNKTNKLCKKFARISDVDMIRSKITDSSHALVFRWERREGGKRLLLLFRLKRLPTFAHPVTQRFTPLPRSPLIVVTTLLVAFASHRMFPERVHASQCSYSNR